ncbi:DUF3597 domain-containing protein [Caldimonas brevitalea]|uniref:DUF3597 domain-containing protein n=1 Tax=Caldimonas brevitalea TaxID=413882 RepID=A0A0G3BMD7_9BURK|nr:DUF3597 domain-containing protein [Caldimonas brevitalea]AKJ29143.1 hypothetical protein AAW51_2452 [Caldimonas brevitalea]
MSILGNIFKKIFPSAQAARAPAPSASAAPTTPAPETAPAAQVGSAAATPTATATAPAPAAIPQVDVEAVLNGLAQNNPQKLNWRTSIVDLLKLLDLDSSLAARKELAQELQYSGDTQDSAAMNVWLHKQVMRKLAENGGKVPADLKD